MTQTIYIGTTGADFFDASVENAWDSAVFRSIGAGDTVLGGAGEERIALTGAGAIVNLGGGNDMVFTTLETRVVNSLGTTIVSARDTIDGGTGTDLLNITANSNQLTAAVKAELVRLQQYLA